MDISEDIKMESGLTIYRDWDCEGAIRMRNAKTVERYRQLKYDTQPDCDKYGVFFAFTNERLDEGYRHLVDLGLIKEGDKIIRYSAISGLFCANKDLLKAYFQFYADIDKAIREECDPQEVYFFEFNNYECMISWDGDDDAIRHIIKIWGKETAQSITRYNAHRTIDEIATRYGY